MNNERISDRVLNSLNRFNTAKMNGSLTPNEYSEIITMVSSLYSNQVKMGKHNTDDEIDSYIANLPNTSIGYFNYNHRGLSEAYENSYESITMAQLDRETRFSKVAKL